MAAFWCCFVGSVLLLVTWLPMLVDWLALPRDADPRRHFRGPLWTQALTIFLFALSIWLRLDHNNYAAALLADAGAAAAMIAVLSLPATSRVAASARRWRSAT